MKKILCLLLAFTMIFTLAACASKTAPSGSEAAEATADDGQNPIMNFVGTYASGRASILVEADGEDGAKFTITWGSSAAEHSEWVMSGKFDPDTLTVEYIDGVRTDYVFAEDGSVESETVVYENGFGTIHFSDEGDSLWWKDDEEHMADDMVFTNTAVEQ